MSVFTGSESIRRIRWILLLALCLVTAMILSPVIKGLLWGAIVAILLSPIHRWVLGTYPTARNSTSLVLVVGAFGAMGLPLIWAVGEFQSEIRIAYSELMTAMDKSPLETSDQIAQIPWVGVWLHDTLESLPRDTGSFLMDLRELIPTLGQHVGELLRGVSTQLFMLSWAFVCSFFLLRDGREALGASRPALLAIVGTDLDAHLRQIRSSVFAVSLGVLGTALLQGGVAMIGYALLGLKTPLLLGLLSALTSLIPIFGASLVWGPIVVGLILDHQEMTALGLAFWGFLVVHPTDNVLRPLLISHLMDDPFFLVLIGIVGGVLAFGVIGVFLGPAVLGILMRLWRQSIITITRNPTEPKP